MTAAPDGFTLYGDPTGGFSIYCDRCPFEPLETGQQSQALDDVAERCVQHLKAKHADDPVTVEHISAPIPYREEWLMGSGGRIVHVPTVHRAVCGHSWMEQDTPRGRVEHRCAKDQGIHQDHVCACKAKRGAGLDIGDPVVARLSKPGPPDCRACHHRQSQHGLYGCVHRVDQDATGSSAMCPCPAMFGGDVNRIAGSERTGGTYTVEESMQILQALGKRGLIE